VVLSHNGYAIGFVTARSEGNDPHENDICQKQSYSQRKVIRPWGGVVVV
jgi:hypothetical protein